MIMYTLVVFSLIFAIANGLYLNTKCDSNIPFCYPLSNTTWFEYNSCEFIWNRNYTFFLNNNTTSVDLYLLYDNQTTKAWENIPLSDGIFSVQVTEDWFPSPLIEGVSNRSWTFNVMAFDHAADYLTFKQPTMELQVIQTARLEKERHGSNRWVIAIIVIGSLGVIIAVACLIWIWRHKKQSSKNSSDLDEKSAGNPDMQHHQASSSILSLDDAKRLATSFRQVLSTSDMEKKRLQIGETILKRNLQAEGTQIVEVGQK